MKTLLRSGIGLVALAAACAKAPSAPSSEPPATPAPATAPSAGGAAGKTPYATLETTQGRIVIRLFPEAAPKTVDNFIGLATGKKQWLDPKTGQPSNRPLYNGTVFHRVIPGFMIQGGDPLGQGIGGPGYQFEDEFQSGKAFDKPGILAMANSGPNTNGSQFFITVAPTPWLNNRHTIFGEVVEGQAAVEAIVSVPRGSGDRPNVPQLINSVTIEYR